VYTGLSVGSTDWGLSFLNSGYYWDIDYETTSTVGLFHANQMQTSPLYFNPTTHLSGYYTFGATPTDFVRNIKVTNNNGNELDVQSIVTWTDGGLSNTVTLEDHFYDYL
jgi:hypothetical protein